MNKPKIIQILIAPNNQTWQGAMYGLGDDGVVYVLGHEGRWEKMIPPVGYQPS